MDKLSRQDLYSLEDYAANLIRMFGSETIAKVVGSVTGEVRFSGLAPTSMKLEGLDKQIKLMESYKKLHRARAQRASV